MKISDFFPETYSSFKENEYKFFRDAAGRELTLIDIPGAERLRKRLLHKYLSERRSIRGIIFVIDSSTFGRKSRDVAELLYDVLYESRKCVPSLVTCNKQDSSLAKSSRVIHITLEHEFGLINGTREAALDSTDGDMKKRVLTATGKDFQWNDLMTTKIDFIECCAIKGFNGGEDGGRKTGLSSVRDWIDSL
ncbi:unnamed protein product [Dracunculus medinensis]|uniref:Signal recognition particle receptor subunit beta n=1 Tax=Dracunculus medinensis TaxID=318479 RepID=A0A3P7S918_DRAME|nr:unnamed protein product [Dracunculus medinensis]